MSDDAKPDVLRIDKWLWAIRFFKTRTLASAACAAGHVKMAGQTVKASKLIRYGDTIEARTPGGEKIVEVLGLADKRGPAPAAQALYADHTPPPSPLDSNATVDVRRERGLGRPSKRDLRKIQKLRGH